MHVRLRISKHVLVSEAVSAQFWGGLPIVRLCPCRTVNHAQQDMPLLRGGPDRGEQGNMERVHCPRVGGRTVHSQVVISDTQGPPITTDTHLW